MNDKQRRFVAEYLKDQNATQAAIRSGYSKQTARQQASDLLSKPNIKSAIQRKLAKIEAKCEVTAERVIAELGRLAFSDMRQLYNAEGGLKPISEWPEDAARAVAGIDTDELFDGFGNAREQVGVTKKVRLWAKNHALETLARHFKLLTDKVEVHASDDLMNALQAARKRRDNAPK